MLMYMYIYIYTYIIVRVYIHVDVSIHMNDYEHLHIHIHIQSSIDHRSHLVNYTSLAAKVQAKNKIIEDFTRHFFGDSA